MRAMVLTETRPAEKSPLELRDLPVPVPHQREIRFRVQCCGVCHTDLHTVEGDLPAHKRPVVPGHQIVGVVDAVGGGVRDHKEGDRVGIPWLHSTDGTCRYCLSDRENLCERAQFTGYDVDGGYGEHALALADFAFSIPKEFSDEAAAPFLCAGIIGYRSFRLSGARHGDRLGLYGFGGSAHLVLQFAKYLGCEVFVFSRGEEHRQLARKLGAVWTGSADDKPPSELDAAIIFAPAGSLVPAALRALRKGGMVALAGITMSEIPAMDYSLIYHERTVRSVANSTRQDAREFLQLAADAMVRSEVQVYPLEQANKALLDLKNSRIRGAAVLRP